MNNTAIIVGAGFAGSVCARVLAEAGWQVRLLEKRDHVGGNAHESVRGNGIRVHTYGPHIYHTSDKRVDQFLSRFTQWFDYKHRVLGYIDGCYVPVPFNFTALELLFPAKEADRIRDTLLANYNPDTRISIFELQHHGDPVIQEFGNYVFNKVFLNYTAKQWGIPISKVDTGAINRVPVVLGYQDTYFNDPIQHMPAEGYNEIFGQMLKHPLIQVELSTNAAKRLRFSADSREVLLDDARFDGVVVYTGALDELFGFSEGNLPYRSIRFVFEDADQEEFQRAAVINYPNDYDYTRITEYKKLTGQRGAGTTISKEYPYQSDGATEPYYPIQSEDSAALYQRYRDKVAPFESFYLCGRLAEYQYKNMDQVVSDALALGESITKKYR